MRIGAPSLIVCAERVIIRKIESLTDVGDMPLHLVQNIIAAVKVPAQLATLEDRSPQIKPKTRPLWEAYIKRDIEKTRITDPDFVVSPRGADKVIVTLGDSQKSFTSIRQAYYALLKNQKNRLAQQQATLKASLDHSAAIKAAQAPTIDQGIPRTFKSELPKYIAAHGMRTVHRDQKSRNKFSKLDQKYHEHRQLEQLARNNAPAAKQQANSFLEKRRADKAKADAEKAAYLAKKKTSSPPAPASIPKKATPSTSSASSVQRAATTTAAPKKPTPPAAATPYKMAPKSGVPAAAESNKRKRSELAIESPLRKRARLIRERAMVERMMEEE